ncbi:GntR family transcriptional regulator [Martelella limonii]|uniref:GntR family transcriptional regulator n=1 Tax=Martelella limonii TaxID=1647649 RepID=UPI001580DBE2|nr:GntR family transcriptional regulator [Martelella limonii]
MSAPRHKQLTRKLREDITSGRIRIGDRLPPEVEFAQLCGVSRTTLRRALSELEAEGLVARRKRVGTVVASQTPQQHFRMRTNSLPEMMRVTRETALEIWSTRMIGGVDEPLLRGRDSPEEGWLEVTAVRRMPGRLRPFCWSRIFAAGAYAGIEASLSRHKLESVFGLIEELYDRPVIKLVQNVTAVACPAGAADAMGISAMAPALCIESELYSHHDELIQVTHSIYDPARFQLRNEAFLG